MKVSSTGAAAKRKTVGLKRSADDGQSVGDQTAASDHKVARLAE